MTQDTQLKYLIQYLWDEQHKDEVLQLPDDPQQRWQLYRGLANQRPAQAVSDAYLHVQDAYLQSLQRPIVTFEDLKPYEVAPDIFLWQGDITHLAVDAIVNAANSDLLGCFIPNHNCIDNVIHTYAGVQLRLACAQIIERQGRKEGVGKAKLTSAYHLPSTYVIHTVGPYVREGRVSQMQKDMLARTYQSCLARADQEGLRHIALCCISTGVFGFPQEAAARIAVETVKSYKAATSSNIAVIFNVFTDEDRTYYKEALSRHDDTALAKFKL